MASVGTLSLFYPVFVPTATAGLAYLGYRSTSIDWKSVLHQFLTGPGRTSRILLLLFVLTNLKSMPLAWTVSAWLLVAAPSGRGCSLYGFALLTRPSPVPRLQRIRSPYYPSTQAPPAARSVSL